MELQADHRLMHYRLVSRLGVGGGGEVWVAEDENLGRRVALKVLPPDLAEDPQRLRRFDQEARALAALSHPNIVVIHSVERTPETEAGGSLRFLTMELIEGKTLAQNLSSGPPEPRRVLAVGQDLASALRAAHARGVVHRDLKPANVMVTEDGRVKVLDFGLARLPEPTILPGEEEPQTEVLTRHGMVMGTCPYMAPEQVRGQGVDPRSDLFALGAVLFEMATGRLAFPGSTSADTFAAILRNDPPPVTELRPDLPAGLAPIVSRCLAKSREERYASAREVEEDLAALRQLVETGTFGHETRNLPTEAVPLPGTAGEPAPSRHSGVRAVPTTAFPSSSASAASAAWSLGAAPAGEKPAPLYRRAPFLASAGTLVAVLLAVVAIVFWPRSDAEAMLDEREAVAVMPFANLTGDPDQSYLSDGLGAGLISRLGEVSGVRVLGRSEAWKARDASGGPAAIARELGVAVVVEGELQRRGDQLQATVQLLDGRDGVLLWSGTFDAPVTELLDLQKRIARELSPILAGPLSLAELKRLARDPTGSYQAYNFYLQGERWLDRMTDTQSAEIAAALFEQAIRQDPEFALAYVGLSEALWRTYHLRGDPELLDEARRRAEEATEIDPELPEAHVAVARVQRSSGEARQAIEGLQEVLQESSRPDRAYRELASSFEQVGEFQEAETCLKLAVAMDSDDWLNWHALGSFHLRTGGYPAARDAYGRAAELAPSDVTWPRENLASLDLLEGRFEEAAAAYEALPGVESNATLATNLGTAYYFLGRLDEAEPHYRRAVVLDPVNPAMRRNLADLYLAQGREEAARSEYREALELVERKLEVESGGGLRVAQALLTAKTGDCGEAVPLAARLREELAVTATNAHDLAAAFALCGERERALDALEDALDHGMSPELILEEDEFRSLHDAPEIRRLLEETEGASERAR